MATAIAFDTSDAPKFTDEIAWGDDSTVISEESTVETAPVAAGILNPPIVMSTWDEQVINEGARDLANEESAVLAAYGIGSSKLLYATGTALADVGHANLEADDLAYRALPPTATAMADLKYTIEREARKDYILDVSKMRINHVGDLAPTTDVTQAGLVIEDTAYAQLTNIADDRNINRGMSRASDLERRIRTRCIGARPSTFAVVSSNARQPQQRIRYGHLALLSLLRRRQ